MIKFKQLLQQVRADVDVAVAVFGSPCATCQIKN